MTISEANELSNLVVEESRLHPRIYQIANGDWVVIITDDYVYLWNEKDWHDLKFTLWSNRMRGMVRAS